MAKRSPYETGELSDSIYLILLSTLSPAHGYGIMQRVEEATGGAVRIGPATMYTTLRKMRDAGWIAEEAEGDGPRILYRATGKGKGVLWRDHQRRERIAEAARAILEGGGNGRG